MNQETTPSPPGGVAPEHAQVLTVPPLIPATAIGSGWLLNRFVMAWPLPGAGNATMATAYSGLALALGGLAVVIFSSSLWHFWKSRQNPEPHTPTNALYTRGIYRHSRNPIYLGFLIAQGAFGLQWNNGWILALIPVTMVVLKRGIIFPEEAYLERLFGEQYRNYKKKVRRWL